MKVSPFKKKKKKDVSVIYTWRSIKFVCKEMPLHAPKRQKGYTRFFFNLDLLHTQAHALKFKKELLHLLNSFSCLVSQKKRKKGLNLNHLIGL